MFAHHTVRSGIAIGLIAAALVVAGCVSRNVESISREEADAMAPPPEPAPPGATPSVAVVPGVDGTVTIDPAVGPPPEGVLYLIVRVAGREGGAPLAVKQLPATFPTAFTITSEDSMIPGTPLVGDLDVIARLDQDGDAFSRQEGDLEGRAGPVQVGDAVEIVLGAPTGVTGGA